MNSPNRSFESSACSSFSARTASRRCSAARCTAWSHRVVGVKRLGEKVVGAGLHGGDGRVDVGEGRHEHDLTGRPHRLDLRQGLEAPHAGHHDVDQRDVGWRALDVLERLPAILGDADLHAPRLEDARRLRRRAGSSSTTSTWVGAWAVSVTATRRVDRERSPLPTRRRPAPWTPARRAHSAARSPRAATSIASYSWEGRGKRLRRPERPARHGDAHQAVRKHVLDVARGRKPARIHAEAPREARESGAGAPASSTAGGSQSPPNRASCGAGASRTDDADASTSARGASRRGASSA